MKKQVKFHVLGGSLYVHHSPGEETGILLITQILVHLA